MGSPILPKVLHGDTVALAWLSQHPKGNFQLLVLLGVRPHLSHCLRVKPSWCYGATWTCTSSFTGGSPHCSRMDQAWEGAWEPTRVTAAKPAPFKPTPSPSSLPITVLFHWPSSLFHPPQLCAIPSPSPSKPLHGVHRSTVLSQLQPPGWLPAALIGGGCFTIAIRQPLLAQY